jgi:hypothetical protein
MSVSTATSGRPLEAAVISATAADPNYTVNSSMSGSGFGGRAARWFARRSLTRPVDVAIGCLSVAEMIRRR